MSGINLLILCLTCLALCNTQVPKNNVFEFGSATWNSDGKRLNDVAFLLTHSSLDILAVQEAGAIVAQATRLSDITVDFRGFPVNDRSFSEYIWNVNRQNFYIYYCDMTLVDSGGTPKQNMALISRERASQVIVIPSEVRKGPVDANVANNYDRTFINRPLMGIVVRNSIFFNLHAEPVGDYNEAPKLLKSTEEYLQRHHDHRQRTWMIMGDFNRSPAGLLKKLDDFKRNVSGENRFFTIVNTRAFTHYSRNPEHAPAELDYAVVGGPARYKSSFENMRANLVTLPSNPSDHVTVKFN